MHMRIRTLVVTGIVGLLIAAGSLTVATASGPDGGTATVSAAHHHPNMALSGHPTRHAEAASSAHRRARKHGHGRSRHADTVLAQNGVQAQDGTDSEGDASGGHQDPPGNVDHQFEGNE